MIHEISNQDYIDMLAIQVQQLKRCADLLVHVNASESTKRTAALKIRAMARILDCDARLIAINAIKEPELEVFTHLQQSHEVIEQFELLECLVVAKGSHDKPKVWSNHHESL